MLTYATVTAMKARHWIVTLLIVIVLASLFGVVGYYTIQPVVLQPNGTVGVKQRDLLVASTIIMLLVVIPVFVLLFYIAWKYRATNRKATYKPNWQSNRVLETIWWGIPLVIVIVLSVIALRSSHELDPYRSLDSDVRPVHIQVVSLQWKWLFIYPEYGVASVNELAIPVDTPIAFSISADSPMNSFWIPELGGQVYAMNGMKTSLHLEATKIGQFRGVSSNISGEGFADMKFLATSYSANYFETLMVQKKIDSQPIGIAQYEVLASPGTVTEAQWYRLESPELFQYVINKYMLPSDANRGYDDTGIIKNHGGGH